MYSELMIKVERINKCFRIYEKPQDRLKQFGASLLPVNLGWQQKRYYREFWALKDVSFEVKKGETLGIVGRNGSGKSTLLQILCGTLTQTSGRITTNGRIAALLELGSGFNPEFTGRENVYLNASVLGLTTNEIDARYDEIASFAEIGEFIEHPVKAYSSGMIVRLAFAVAISINPDILIVDEALSVGDELFQRKCFSRIETLRSTGVTILFVSHSGGTVVQLCDRALLLDSGERIAIGKPNKIIGCYQKLLHVPLEKQAAMRNEIRSADESTIEGKLSLSESSCSDPEVFQKLDQQMYANDVLPDSFDPSLIPLSTISYESYGAVIHDPQIYTLDGKHVNNITRGRTYNFCYRVSFDGPASNVRFGMLIKTSTGLELGGATSASSYQSSLQCVRPGTIVFVKYSFTCRLNPGLYFLNAGCSGDLNGSLIFLHRLVDAAVFRVISETDLQATGTVDFSCFTVLERCDPNCG